MDILLLQSSQGLWLCARDGGHQPRGDEDGGLHGQDQQHHGPAHQQGQDPGDRVRQQEEHSEEPRPEHEAGSAFNIQQR